ncbi:MAG: ABC transporter substrate-binding protein, partial [Pseudomonadota bacterium]
MKTRILLAAAGAALIAGSASAQVKVGFIGSMSSDTGLSTLRGAEMAIDEMNAAGGFMGQEVELVTADTGEDVNEGIRAYEYLAEDEEVDFIISGSIDDVSLVQVSSVGMRYSCIRGSQPSD